MIGLANAVKAAALAVKAAAEKIDPPKQHVVGQRETLASVGAKYGVSADAIRRANPTLPPFVEPPVGLTLDIPESEDDAPLYNTAPKLLTLDGGAPATPPTVDQALDNLAKAESNLIAAKDAVGSGHRAYEADLNIYETAVTQARADLRGALDRDITASADARPTGGVNNAAHVRAEGAAIAARHEGNPAARAAIEQEVAGLATDREVHDTKTIVLSQTDGTQMGKLLASELPKLSPEAQARLMQDPDIRKWIVGDFAGVDPDRIETGDQQRQASAQADGFTRRLAEVTSQLPPEQAEALTRTMMPDIRKAGDGKLIPNGREEANHRFDELSRVAASLGDTPQADALVDEIAASYAPVLANAPFVSQTVHYATTGDGGPRLAVAVAKNVEGRDDVPPSARADIMGGVQTGIDQLRGEVDFNMKQYGTHMGKLDAASEALEGLPGSVEARQKYLDGQPQAFKDRMNELSGIAADSGTKLMRAMAGLSDMPPGLDRDTGLQGVLTSIADNKTTQVALVMGAQKNPNALLGAEGKQAIEFLTGVKMGKEGTEFLRSFTTLVVGTNQSSAIELALKGDVDGARAMLKDWADPSWAAKAGIDPKLYGEMNGKLDEIIAAKGDPAALNAKIGEMNTLMDDRGALMAPDTNAGKLFRGLNLTASIALAGKSVPEALQEGGFDKWFSAIGDTAGVLKDGTDFVASLMGKAEGTAVKGFVNTFGAISVAMDAAKIFSGETTFDKGAAAISAMGGGFMFASGLATTGAATFGLAFIGAALILTIEWAKGREEQKKQLWELNGMSRKALEELVPHGLDPAAIPELARRGGDSGEFAAAPVLVEYLAKRGYSPEEALAWINDAQRQGKLQSVMSTAVTQSTEIGENPGDAEVKAESDASMERTIRAAGLPLK